MDSMQFAIVKPKYCLTYDGTLFYLRKGLPCAICYNIKGPNAGLLMRYLKYTFADEEDPEVLIRYLNVHHKYEAKL